MCTSAMLYVIQTAIIWTVLSNVAAQKWPREGSCAPCHCSVQESKYTYGLVKYVNCSNIGLVTVPSNLPTDLDFLDLSYNNIDNTNIQSVCDFESLQFLSLAYNFFTSIVDSPFSRCSLLVKLDLTGSGILYLRNDTFHGLDNLQTIYGLEAESVELGVFEKMLKLKTLEFLFLGESIPEQIFAGLPVETLNITLNMVVKVPEGLFEFGEKTLQFLCLSGPKVTFIYENLFRGLTVLRKVEIHMPKLVSLPERLFSNFGTILNQEGDPRNLQEITLTSMNAVPKTIFKDLESLQRLEIHEVHDVANSDLFDDLVNLEVLDLTKSSIVQIPTEWFSKLYSLKTLNLSNCNLRIIEDRSLIGLMNLKTLDLSTNALRNIPLKTFDPLRDSIQNLHLGGNILKSIDNQLFCKMVALQYLDLSDNKLDSISDGAFSDLKRLNSLQLQENKLLFLPVNLFLHQPNLQILNLGTNSFRRIPLSVQKSAGFLLRLYLPNNRIFSLPETLPTDLPYLEYLSLTDNNLQCRCRLLSIKLYKPNLYIDGTCAAPRIFRGKHIMSFGVPENCEGPRPTEGTRTETSKATQTSTVLSSPPGQYEYNENYSYYGNYYYGSDEYYAYETDHYYVDLQTTDISELFTSATEASVAGETTVEESTQKSFQQSYIVVSSVTKSVFDSFYRNTSFQGNNASQFYGSSVVLHASLDASYNISSLLPTEPLSMTVSKSIVTSSIAVESSSSSASPDLTSNPSVTLDLSSSLSSKKVEETVTEKTEEDKAVKTPSLSYSSTHYTKYSTDHSESSTASSGFNTIMATTTVSVSSSDDVVPVIEKPTGVETGTTGMDPKLKLIIGFMAGGALVCICGTLWWLKNQIAKRRMYEVTPSSTVV